MLETYAQSIAHFLYLHPHWGGILTFLVAFAESIAVIGTIVPGSVTMSMVGVLIGTSVLPLGSTLLWATFGALVGDVLSYGLGAYYKDQLRNRWPFRKHPNWITTGEAYFKKHGGKSVFLGRFFGPMRSIIPMIAGILKMPLSRFVIAAAPSAFLWAFLYMLPGILIGALSLELPKGTGVRFITVSILIIIILALAGWLIRHFFKQIAHLIDRFTFKVWQFCLSHKRFRWIATLLADNHRENYKQLTLLFFAIITFILTLWILLSLIFQGPLSQINQPVHELLRSLRTPHIDNVMLVFTLLGSKALMFILGLFIVVALLWFRHWRATLHWLTLLLISFGSLAFFKTFFYSARPSGLLHGPASSSLPSGHTLLSLCLLGFLSVLISKNLESHYKKIPYFMAGLLISLIALSRIYLGAHWPTDVLISTFFGFTIILLLSISYNRKPSSPLPSIQLGIFSIIVIILLWSGSLFYFKKTKYDYTPYWPSATIRIDHWWGQSNQQIPIYRTNRLGKPIEPMNIQWTGSLETIKTSLEKQGWVLRPPTPIVQRAALELAHKHNHDLPLLPFLFQNKEPTLIMTKDTAERTPLILRLWESNIQLANNDQPFWLGSIGYYSAPHKLFVRNKEKPEFIGTIHFLTPFLHDFEWREIKIALEQQPAIMRDIDWDGHILQIRSP